MQLMKDSYSLLVNFTSKLRVFSSRVEYNKMHGRQHPQRAHCETRNSYVFERAPVEVEAPRVGVVAVVLEHLRQQSRPLLLPRFS